jgi:hypothetical protein
VDEDRVEVGAVESRRVLHLAGSFTLVLCSLLRSKLHRMLRFRGRAETQFSVSGNTRRVCSRK